MTDYSYNFFANRSTQTLAQDTYYHTFYQVSQENPNTMITYTYDNSKNLIETFDVSFGAFSVSEALQILDQSGANPYVVGTNSSGTEFIPMDIGYFDIYNRFLTTSQHKGVMTKVNKTATNIPPPPELIFTSNDTFTLSESKTIYYCVVGGGGCGGLGMWSGGGGGGGEVVLGSTTLNAGSYTIIVGEGGVTVDGNGSVIAKGTYQYATDTSGKGGNSQILNSSSDIIVEARGGARGSGGNGHESVPVAVDGLTGSGGGGSQNESFGTYTSSTTYGTHYGNNGADQYRNTDATLANGGGGGGASEPGYSGSDANYARKGGDGILVNSTNLPYYSGSSYFGGGGEGSFFDNNTSFDHTTVTPYNLNGGGGNGSISYDSWQPYRINTSGTPNTGGGGGGTGKDSGYALTGGGSGIVIITYSA